MNKIFIEMFHAVKEYDKNCIKVKKVLHSSVKKFTQGG